MHVPKKKITAASIAAILVALGPAFTASAHVSPVEPTSPANGYTTVELQVPHGCEGAATESVAVQLSEQVSSVKAQAIPGWSVTYERQPLTDPIELHGQEVADYISVVTWTAEGTPLPDDQYMRFGISLKTPDTPGETLRFPTVQSCVGGGTSSWIEDDPDGDHPAPSIELTAAQGGHDATEGSEPDTGTSASPTEEADTSTVTATSSGSGSDALARGLGGLAVLLAAAAVVLSVRKRTV